jgi:hypothetical protein
MLSARSRHVITALAGAASCGILACGLPLTGLGESSISVDAGAHVAVDATAGAPHDGSPGGEPPTGDPDAGPLEDAMPGPSVDAGPAGDFSCNDWDAEVEVDASSTDASPSFESDGGSLPGPPPAICSAGAVAAASITFVNQAPCPIEAWWVDYSCHETSYGIVAPGGGALLEQTYTSHVWRLRAAGTEQLLREIPPAVDTTPRTITYP